MYFDPARHHTFASAQSPHRRRRGYVHRSQQVRYPRPPRTVPEIHTTLVRPSLETHRHPIMLVSPQWTNEHGIL